MIHFELFFILSNFPTNHKSLSKTNPPLPQFSVICSVKSAEYTKSLERNLSPWNFQASSSHYFHHLLNQSKKRSLWDSISLLWKKLNMIWVSIVPTKLRRFIFLPTLWVKGPKKQNQFSIKVPPKLSVREKIKRSIVNWYWVKKLN